MNETNSLAHTKWNCKYHMVFAAKYRRKVFFGEKRREIGKILRQLCEWKKVTIVEAESMSESHSHASWDPTQNRGFYPCTSNLKTARRSAASFCLSGIPQSSKPRFWVSGILCRYRGKNAKKIEEYIRNQLEEDKMGEQLTKENF